MKKSVCIAWIEALRSGNYKQHRGSLTSNSCSIDLPTFKGAKAHCCLGVAIEVDCKINGNNPDEVRLISVVGHYISINGPEQATLIYMNDTEYKSFPEIADYIEANILPNCTEE